MQYLACTSYTTALSLMAACVVDASASNPTSASTSNCTFVASVSGDGDAEDCDGADSDPDSNIGAFYREKGRAMIEYVPLPSPMHSRPQSSDLSFQRRLGGLELAHLSC